MERIWYKGLHVGLVWPGLSVLAKARPSVRSRGNDNYRTNSVAADLEVYRHEEITKRTLYPDRALLSARSGSGRRIGPEVYTRD